MQQPFTPSASNQMMIPKWRTKSTMFVSCYLLSFLRIQLRKSTYRDKNLDYTVQSNVLLVMWSVALTT